MCLFLEKIEITIGKLKFICIFTTLKILIVILFYLENSSFCSEICTSRNCLFFILLVFSNLN